MCQVTISLLQLFERFPDQDTARCYMERQRWPNGVWCPHCGEPKRIGSRKGGYYQCNACMAVFTVRTRTVMERSHIPLHKWIYGMYLLVTARKGISSLQLSKELGITQKSAWFMLQRLREACKDTSGPLSGIVEIDETYVGGKRHNIGRGPVGKQPVLGMRERGGDVKAVPIRRTSRYEVRRVVDHFVDSKAIIYTDEHRSYIGLRDRHETVKHSVEEWARGEVYTNSIESVWAVLKRGLRGVYHHASFKHLDLYVSEFTFRLNQGRVERHTMDRIASMLSGGVGRRLTYAALTEGVGT